MTELNAICRAVAGHLNARGIRAVTAWDDRARTDSGAGVVAVSVRRCTERGAGLWDYLGERYDETAQRWEELYGRRLELTLGLDLYARGEENGGAACEAAFDKLVTALDGAGGWLKRKELRRGETAYREEEDRFCCKAEADCLVFLTAAADESGVFRDFTVRGNIS